MCAMYAIWAISLGSSANSFAKASCRCWPVSASAARILRSNSGVPYAFWGPSLRMYWSMVNAASPAWLPCMIISRYGPAFSGNGRSWYCSWPAVSIISILTLRPMSLSSLWITSMVSVIFGNCAVRPISRICLSTGTPSALASATNSLALSGSCGHSARSGLWPTTPSGMSWAAGSPSPRNNALTMPVRLTE